VADQTTVYFDVTTSDFRRQLQQLKDAETNVISLADLYDHLENGKEIPPRAVVLTFDDGYLGNYEKAYPLLKEFNYPATFFVHTSVVGVKTSRDHMTWDQLKKLDQEGLISVECHTATHPDDLRKLDDTQLEAELVESKKVMEEKLGRKVRFLAYPVGNADSRVAKVAREAGYEMCFTMGPGWAGSPEDAYFVPRFLPKYLPEIMTRLKSGELSGVTTAQVLDLAPTEIESGYEEDGQVRMKWIRGGKPFSVRINSRATVPTFVKYVRAAAGLNGTFFSDARVNSSGAGIVGPVASRLGPGFAPGLPGDRERIAGRPLVVFAPDKIGFLPFRPHLALDAEGVERLVPGATDCFIGGAWLVHKGVPLTHEEMERFRLENIFDFRPRAFFGVDDKGRAFLGASSTGNQSDRLAETIAKLGLKECILLDSGFSTSLVLGEEVLVKGIRRTDMPARPVPHALVLYPVDASTGEVVMKRNGMEEAGGASTPPPTLEMLAEQFASGYPQIEEYVPTPEADQAPRRRRSRRRR
jgi:peptidoglycan/xylan/chitin deacetylase (PgdA/CDA1 family)